jgi:hypothetical protein
MRLTYARFLAAITALLVLGVPQIARSDEACWAKLDAAIARRAELALPAYISYDVQRTISHGYDVPLVTHQAVVYRTDDALARVVDSLYGDTARITADLEPGPPIVGPSVSLREGWVSRESRGTIIATVHAHAGKACDDIGRETVDGHVTEHLHLTPYRDDRPALRDIWIGVDDGEVWRATVAQFIDAASIMPGSGVILADFHIEIGRAEAYAVVTRVRYDLSRFNVKGEYRFSGYRFSTAVPPGTLPAEATP